MLIHQLDPNGARTSTINPDLRDLLSKFAYYMHDTRKAGVSNFDPLCRDIFDNWLSIYFGSAPVHISIGADDACQLLPAYASQTDLLNGMRATLRSAGTASLYGYVGLLQFTAWYFLIGSRDGDHFNDHVKEYMSAQCLAWTWKSLLGRVTVDGNYVYSNWPAQVTNTARFLNSFPVRNLPLETMAGSGFLGDIAMLFNVRGAVVAGTKHSANFSFLKFFRGLLEHMLQEEYLCVLETLGTDISKRVLDSNFFAVGTGTTTTGFFGTSGIGQPRSGLVFFNYDLERLSDGPPYCRGKLTRDVPIWQAKADEEPPSFFIAQIGANWAGSTVDVVIDGEPSLNSITIAEAPSAPPRPLLLGSTNDARFTYDQASRLLTVDRTSRKVELRFTSVRDPAVAPPLPPNYDEIAFLTFSFSPPTPPLPTIPANDPRLRVDYLFLDNEFAIPTSASLGFWTAAPQQAALNQIILKMRDDPAFTIAASIMGKGIGQRVDVFATDDFNSDLESAPDQADNEIPNNVALANVGLRYAYGDAIWTTPTDGGPGVLNLCTEGFASPLRCTWATWAPFLIPRINLGGVTKASLLLGEIGQYLLQPLAPDPSYNVALSSFRAFGMLEAMINRLKNCADHLDPSQLNDAQRDAIKAKLAAFLATQASCALAHLGLDRLAGVTITYSMFQKYAY
jgi:hypothetical protein